MNYKNCVGCHQSNPAGMRFCLNCGAEFMPLAEPAPTIMVGYEANLQAGEISPGYRTQPFQPQPADAKPKSLIKKILLVGVTLCFVFLATLGIGIWFGYKPITRHFWAQKREWKQEENQMRADRTTASALLPTEFNHFGENSIIYRRSEIFDRQALLQASQKLSPEMKPDISKISDASAASYVSPSVKDEEVFLKIFKFNTPEQAKGMCRQMGEELERRRATNSTEVKIDVRGPSDPTYCLVEVKGKNKDAMFVTSLYGFLYIATGNGENAVRGARNSITQTLNQ